MQAQVDQADATIVRLDAEVERARVTLDDANIKLRRANDLFEQQLIAKMDLDSAAATAAQAEAALKSAQAQVTQARASLNQNRVNLSHTVITAPVDGIVISRNVDVGQTVAASMSAPVLFVIAKDLSEMQVNASIDEADIGQIKPGQSVTFKVDAYPRETFTGTVSQVRLAPVVAQNVVSYVTVIDVPNKELKLKPGMTANVTVEIARADDVLRVQNAALRFQPPADVARPEGERGRRVWVLAHGELQPVRVRTGISDATTTAILDGSLDEHAQVATGIVATQASSSTPSSASPLIPQRPGFNRQQGGNNTRRPATGAGR
jgi:HlyD family secretion protein